MRALLTLLALALPLTAAPHTPDPGSKERTAILDALRDPLEDGFGQPVIFRVRHLMVDHGWAYIEAEPRTKGDKPLTWDGTVWDEESEFMDDPSVMALLHLKRGRWYVVKQFLAPTDYPLDFFFRYKAPRTIFPKLPNQ